MSLRNVEKLSEEELYKLIQETLKPKERFADDPLLDGKSMHKKHPMVQLLKYLPRMTPTVLVASLRTICNGDSLRTATPKERMRFFAKIELEIHRRIPDMAFEQLIDSVYFLAKANHGSKKLFDDISSEIIDYKPEILKQGLEAAGWIDKFLWAFMIRDHGTSEFFYEVASMIKKLDRENMVTPKQLAVFCNYFSKLSNSLDGGFGTYRTAEEKIMYYLPKLNYHELVSIAGIMLPQSIPSPKFLEVLTSELADRLTRYEKMEESILEKKLKVNPSRLQDLDIKITVGDNVRLLKAFATPKFRGNSLVERLMARMIFYLPYMSNQQIEDTLWSLSKGGFQNKDLYQGLEKEFAKRIKTLSLRGLSFSFSEFVQLGFMSPDLLGVYLTEFSRRKEVISAQAVRDPSHDNDQFQNEATEEDRAEETQTETNDSDPSAKPKEPTSSDNTDPTKQSTTAWVHYRLLILKGLIHCNYIFASPKLHGQEAKLSVLMQTMKSLLEITLSAIENNVKDPLQFKTRDLLKITDLFREGLSVLAAVDTRVQTNIFSILESVFLTNYGRRDKSGVLGVESNEDDYFFEANELANEEATRFSFADLCRVYVNYTICRTGSKYFMESLSSEILSKVIHVPKRNFCSVLYALAVNGVLKNELPLFCGIIYELHKYGDFKFFFSHRDFIRLIWGLLHNLYKEQYIVYEPPVPRMLLVLSPKYLSPSQQQPETEETVTELHDEIFHKNFAITKRLDIYTFKLLMSIFNLRLVSITRMSLEEIFTVLSDINPNTLEPLELRLNIQSLLRLDFLLKGDKRSDISQYLTRMNNYISEKVIQEESALRTIGFERTSAQERAKEVSLRQNLLKVLTNYLKSAYGNCEIYSAEMGRDDSEPLTHPIIFTDFQDETFSTVDYLLVVPDNDCRIGFSVTSGDLLLPHEKTVLHGQSEAQLQATAFANNTHMVLFSRDLGLEELEIAIPKVFPAVQEYEKAAGVKFTVKSGLNNRRSKRRAGQRSKSKPSQTSTS